MASSPDFTILNAARISYAGFSRILGAARSPATNEAAACYQAALSYGVDPAVMLGVFRKESTYGRYGVAAKTRSWGNIRASNGTFKSYATWADGARDCARLLAVYGANRIRPGTKTSTVQTFPYVWAPSSDGNSPDAYGDSIVSWIIQWQTAYPGPGAGGGASSGDTGSGSTVSSTNPTTLAAYLGIPPATPVTDALLVQAAGKIADATGQRARAYPVIITELRDYLAAHQGVTAGAFPIYLTAEGTPPGIPLPDVVGTVLSGVTHLLGNAAAVIVLIGFLFAGIYLIATSE